MSNPHEHIYVPIQQGEDGYPPYTQEEVDAYRVEGDLWRIDAAPVFVYGLARGDVVRTRRDEDRNLWATEIVSSEGNWCARVVLRSGDRDILDPLVTLGCEIYPTDFGLHVVDVSSRTEVEPILAALDRGELDGIWHYDLGVDPRA